MLSRVKCGGRCDKSSLNDWLVGSWKVTQARVRNTSAIWRIVDDSRYFLFSQWVSGVERGKAWKWQGLGHRHSQAKVTHWSGMKFEQKKTHKTIRIGTCLDLRWHKFYKNTSITSCSPINDETTTSAQRVPEPDPLPSISFDTRPDPIQF